MKFCHRLLYPHVVPNPHDFGFHLWDIKQDVLKNVHAALKVTVKGKKEAQNYFKK